MGQPNEKVQEAMLYAGKIISGGDAFGYSPNEQRILVLADEIRSLREQLTHALSLLPKSRRRAK